MSFNWGIGDLLSVTQLAWNLYHNCYLVAKEAPDEFRQLVNELASLQGVLRTLRDDINSDTKYLEKLGEQRKETLERCLRNCYDTLKLLEQFVTKYREFGIRGGVQFWRKIKWVTQQGDISTLRSKIMVHSCNLSLCMSSIGNSSLSRLEGTMAEALNKQQNEKGSEATKTLLEDSNPLKRSQMPPDEAMLRTQSQSSDSIDSPLEKTLNRRFTDVTLVHPASPESTPTPSFSEEGSDWGEMSSLTRHRSPPQGKAQRTDSVPVVRPKDFPPSPRNSVDELPEHKRRPSTVAPADAFMKDKSIAPDVVEAVAEAMKELLKIRRQEQTMRPLRVAPQDEIHRPDDELKAKFQDLANDELKIRRLNVRDWLRVATWWLLKARSTLRLYQIPSITNARGSFSNSGDSRAPSNQAYVDLLKASWILYDVVLKDDNLTPLLVNENRQLFYNLQDAISEDCGMFKEVDIPERQTLRLQNLNIWELQQPEEENFEDIDMIPGLENGRWITVEQDHAGEEDEEVLFRTFVNAEIGTRRLRMKSRGAPYMLVLSTKEGESEPKITICNQSGSFCLTRDYTIDDVVEPEDLEPPISPVAQSGMSSESSASIPLHFGKLKVFVSFQSRDLIAFQARPIAYFKAVKDRDLKHYKDASEKLLFRCSVERFEMLKPATMTPTHPRDAAASCDLRIMEIVKSEGWRSTRRLVLSSSVGEKHPWCKSRFLPLSRVQIKRDEDSRQITVKWSDCSHEIITTDGAYNKVYTYTYDENNPNLAMLLDFRTQADASDFEKAVLSLSQEPHFEWSCGPDNHALYDISDAEPNPKDYKAIIRTHSHLKWKYSELYYFYRDIDFQFNRDKTQVRFPGIYSITYLSNHVEILAKPDPRSPPRFSHCQKKISNVVLDFSSEPNYHAFMSSLTNGYTLLFSRRVHWIAHKPPSRFHLTKKAAPSSKGAADLLLWRKSRDTFRLSFRWDDRVDDKWLSLTVPRSGVDTLTHSGDSNRASIPSCQMERGRSLNMSQIVGCNPKDIAKERTVAPLVIAFESVRDREDFAHAISRADGGGGVGGGGARKDPVHELLESMEKFRGASP